MYFPDRRYKRTIGKLWMEDDARKNWENITILDLDNRLEAKF